MKYQIRRIPIEFKTGQIIEFSAQTLCKVLEVDVFQEGASVIVLERWGEYKGKEKKHKIIIMKENEECDITFAYEPVLSRRSKFVYRGVTYYTFSLQDYYGY